MLIPRPSAARGHADHGWLDSYHTFSFADYYDPNEMGWSVLRVINEDRVQPGKGFGTHGHRDMEIITYVLEGGLRHQDSMGNGAVIRPGDVQRMSAGRGVTHSEFNASAEDIVHLLQIWILPDTQAVAPSYEQIRFPDEDKQGRLRLVASHDGREGSVRIHQDAAVYASVLGGGQRVRHDFAPGRRGYVHAARGALRVNDLELGAGDGLKIADEAAVIVEGRTPCEFLLFDLP